MRRSSEVIREVFVRTRQSNDSMANSSRRMGFFEDKVSPMIAFEKPGEFVDSLRSEVVEVASTSIVFESVSDRRRRSNDDDPFAVVLIAIT